MPDVILSESVEVVASTTKELEVITLGVQGPPGPPTGVGTETENLPFIGSGVGASKTTTVIVGNKITESFNVGDELFVLWRFSDALDTSKDIKFSGGFMPLAAGVDRTSLWEVHVTSVGGDGATEITSIITTPEFPIPDIAEDIGLGSVDINHATFDFANSQVIHIRLKRIASSNDSGVVAVAGLAVSYSTDGRVGEKGDPGIPGEDEDVTYEDNIDFLPKLSNADNETAWSGTSVQVIGDVRSLPGTAGLFLYCSVAGTTGATEPTPTESAENVSDGTATWIAIEYGVAIFYTAQAIPLTADADYAWRIKRTILRSDDDLRSRWAGDPLLFDKTWNDHLILVYG